MAKVLRCYNFVTDCDFAIRAETEEEVLAQAEEHGRTQHKMKEFSPETLQRLRESIKDE